MLLILTYTALGFESGGNRNWIDLGFTSIQPSEFAKLAMIIWGADVLARKDKLLDQPRHLLIPYLPVCGILILLVVFQGDAGTAVVMGSIMVGVLFIVGTPIRVLAALGFCAIGGVVTLFVTSPVRMRRLAAFLDPTADLNGANDQANAGMWAIASGGWWGQGLGGSRQKWGGLPVAHSDFIFAVIGEELGLFGSLIVLALFLVLGYAGLRIATRSDEPFRRYAAAGVTVWFMVQALINLAVVLRLLPIAGRAPAAGLLRRLGPDRQPAGPRRAAVLCAARAGRPQAAGLPLALGQAAGERRGRLPAEVGMSPAQPGAPVSVVLAGGGTAGHTSPLIATAQEIVRLAPDAVVTAVGTARGLETSVVPAAGLTLELIPPVPLPRKPGKDLLLVPARLRRAVAESARLLDRLAADVVLGFGGYVSTPVYLAARRRRIPIVIHEQNALPGLANRLAARFSDHVFTSFPDTPLPGATCIGLPLRAGITGLDRVGGRAAARASFGLPADGQALLVSGGSQGAASLNRAVLGARTTLLAAGVSVLHAVGPKNLTDDLVAVTDEHDRGGLPAARLHRGHGRRVRRGRPDARPLRGEHRAGDRRGRAAGRVRAVPARQRRAGAQRRGCRVGRRRGAAGRRRLHPGVGGRPGAQPDPTRRAARNGRGPGRCWTLRRRDRAGPRDPAGGRLVG